MVNTPIIHPNPFVRAIPALPWPPPESGEANDHTRLIPFKVWELEELQTIAQSQIEGKSDVIRVVTGACIDDMQQEKLVIEDVAEFVLMLEPDDYENSRWCMSSRKAGVNARPELRWLPCDAYTLTVNETDEHGVISDKTYYIKLCRTLDGGMLLIVSLHQSDFLN